MVDADGFTGAARTRNADLWGSLANHGFVRGMADGTLPAQSYQFYVEQNLLYLPQYARAIALAVARSRTPEELVEYTASLVNIVDVEIPQNEELLRLTRSLTGSTAPRADRMAAGCRNYTSYLLAVAASGDATDIAALILPCAWSYGEIARSYRGKVAEHPVYTAWFDFFSTDEYEQLVLRMRGKLDAATAESTEARRGELHEIFTAASELELGFWDMALAGGERLTRFDDQPVAGTAVPTFPKTERSS